MHEVLGVVSTLWPLGERRPTRRPGRSASLLVLPSRRSPRLLVPARTPGAALMLRRHSNSRRQRLAQEALVWGLRCGVLPFLPVTRMAAGPGVAVS